MSTYFACVSCGRQPAPAARTAEETMVPVAVEAAELGNVRGVLHAVGIVVPAPDAEFIAIAPEPARILEISKAEGESVAANELLVRLDVPSIRADASRQRSEVADARAAVENARVLHARARDLAERGLIARRELEDADRALTDAQSELARAEVLQAAADTAVERTTIRAPFAGIVVTLLRKPGDVVSGAATDPILRLVDPNRLEVRASVPVKDLSRVLPGATARLAAGGDIAGARLTVAARPGANEAGSDGTVQVRLAFTEPTSVMVDTPVQVDIDLEERPSAVVIAPEAIVREGATAAVFVVMGDVATRREVTLGIEDDSRVEVTSGVNAGDLVVVRGQVGLQDGARVSVSR